MTAALPRDTELSQLVGWLLQSAEFAPRPCWAESIVQIAESLGQEPATVEPFVSAWRTLYTMTLWLDHVQDGDPIADPCLASLPTRVQYLLAFATYAAAQHALTACGHPALPAERVHRLHAFWAESLLQLADGQHADLTSATTPVSTTLMTPLEHYEAIAAAKTGATFALALGGAAILATDNIDTIETLIAAGTIYGLLLQYQDDLADQAAQGVQPATLTLVRALGAAHPTLAEQLPPALAALWTTIRSSYTQALDALLAPLPPSTQTVVRQLIAATIRPGLAPAPDTTTPISESGVQPR